MHEEYDVCFNETQKCDLIAIFKRLEHKHDLDFSYNDREQRLLVQRFSSITLVCHQASMTAHIAA